MSFTITCNKCGQSVEFKDNDYRYNDGMEVDVGQYGYENAVREVILYCGNINCDNMIDIKFR